MEGKIKVNFFRKSFVLFLSLFCIQIFFLSYIYAKEREENLPHILNYKDKEMILIPAGYFWMGTQVRQGEIDEHPQHKVYLDNYYIDKYEVTNKEYCEFLNAQGNHRTEDKWWLVIDDAFCLIELKNGVYSSGEGYENYPVVSVTWEGAKKYAEWCKKSLPTEAEWEKAAKGSEGYLYPWGMNWDYKNCNNKLLDREEALVFMIDFHKGHGILPVGTVPEDVSHYGVMDMAGNVKEWCKDWYSESYYEVSPYKNPQGPEKGDYRVIRGGAWDSDDPKDFRTSDRFFTEMDRGFSTGFRCVLHPEDI